MNIRQINRYVSKNASTATSSSDTSTTRWNEVFGDTQNKYNKDKNISSNSTTPINNYQGNSTSGVTSLNIGLNPQVADYNKYKAFNDLEKQFQEQGIYNVEDITNPYHYTKTNNYFSNDIKKEFTNVYGNWDGYAKGDDAFAYIDKYGNSAISKNFFNALIYSKDGQVYNFEGDFKYGYAVDANGNRMWLAGLEGSTPYSNFVPKDSMDKDYVTSKIPGFFDEKQLNPSYSDRYPYISKSYDSISQEKFNLYNIPIYYGKYIDNNANTNKQYGDSRHLNEERDSSSLNTQYTRSRISRYL